MNKPTVMEELVWCEVELDNIKAGLFSMYSKDYIEGAISALNLAKEGEGEPICPFCLDNSKSCKACDDSYEGE